MAEKHTIANKRQDNFFDIPFYENLLFTGRDEELRQLRNRLSAENKTTSIQAICGLSGIGKTQLAVKYACKYRNQYQYVFWIQFPNEITRADEAKSIITITNSYVEICRKLGLSIDESQPQTATPTLKQWMEHNQNWLLIFDNVHDSDQLKSILPKQCQGHVVLTSRSSSFPALGIHKPIELDQLPLEKATEFLLKRVSRDVNTSEQSFAEELVTEVNGLPLALELAGAFIQETSITFERYLGRFRYLWREISKKREPILEDDTNSARTTWFINLQALEDHSEASAHLLCLSAFLSPDAIPYELISQGTSLLGKHIQESMNQFSDPVLAVNELLQPLVNYSLISKLPSEREFCIHPLVREAVRAELQIAEAEQTWAEDAVNAVNQIYPWPEYSNWQLCHSLSSQSLLAIEHIERFKIQTETGGALLSKQGRFFHDIGQYETAESLYLQAMKINHSVLGETHPHYATSLNNLASLYQSQGSYEAAETLYLQAMEISYSVLGETHPHFAASLNNLASLYECQGRYEEAGPLYLQDIEIIRIVLGETHPDLAIALNNLAALHVNRGCHAEAEPLYLQAIDIFTSAFGSKHPNTKTARRNYHRFKELKNQNR